MMQCPTCAAFTPDAWMTLVADGTHWQFRASNVDPEQVTIDCMHCANPECGQFVVRIQETRRATGPVPIPFVAGIWIARPRVNTRFVDPLVPDAFRKDFQEAASIVSLSPRMSAVLSRKILQDVLAEYASLSGFSLSAQIDKFIDDSTHPSSIRQNLHHLREIADFGAHTQRDGDAQVIMVTDEEATWTLEIIERLFDYFMIGPEKDRVIREGMNKKIADANRRPIVLPGENPEEG